MAAGCEVLGRLVTGLRSGPSKAERAAFLAHLPGELDAVKLEGVRRYVQMAYGARYELHPFFGYTFYRGHDGANNQGFMTGGIDFPYRKAPREFVIGVFGGSVAMQTTGRAELITAPIEQQLAAKGYERVTLLSFGVGGWRQPQTYHALVHLLPMIDMAINLDGFNEAIQLGAAQQNGYPAAFPPSDIYGALSSRADDVYLRSQQARLVVLNEAMVYLTGFFDAWPYRKSVFLHLVWRVLAAQHARIAARLRSRSSESTAGDWRGIDPVQGSVADWVESYHRLYADMVRYSDMAARRENKVFFHFLQPNQYDRGSKPLSDEERDRYVRNDWFDQITPEYRALEAMSAALSREGVASYSLTDLFAHVPETTYSDECCHLNERGVELLNRAIAERVLASGRLEAIPPGVAASTERRP